MAGRKERQSKRKKTRKLVLENSEQLEEKERKLTSKLESLIQKMEDFEDKNKAYNIKRMEITKKAVAF